MSDSTITFYGGGTGGGPETDPIATPIAEEALALAQSVESDSAAHVATPVGAAHALLLPSAPPVISGVTAEFVPGEGDLPAGEYLYWAAAIFADNSVTDWNNPAAFVTIITAATGAVTLSCDAVPEAVGYRWYGGLGSNGERYWDTVAPTYTDTTGTGGGDSYNDVGAVYVPPGAVPYAVVNNFSPFPPEDWVLPGLSGALWAPFNQSYSTDPERFEFVPEAGAVPPHLHIKLPGVYHVTLQAIGVDTDPWDTLTGNLIDIEGGNLGFLADYHSGHIPATPGFVDGSGRPQMVVTKMLMTAGADDSLWTLAARFNNANATARSIGTLEMKVFTLVR